MTDKHEGGLNCYSKIPVSITSTTLDIHFIKDT